MQQALRKVALPHLIFPINIFPINIFPITEVKDWTKVLSVGEQQRIAFVRILLNEPTVALVDG